MTEPEFRFHKGTLPLLISIPHLGTEIPEVIGSHLTEIASEVADTDWHLDKLYEFARLSGASVLGAVDVHERNHSVRFPTRPGKRGCARG